MKKIQYKILIASFTMGLLFLLGCADEVAPTLMDIPPGGQPDPIINSVEPANVALAGITKLTITGTNFSATKENNSVYFNGKPGTIISSTTTQLEVVSAVVVADTVLIKVAVFGAEQFSNSFMYKLEAAVTELYPFKAVLSEFPYAVTVDPLENVYVSLSGKGTKKIDPQGNISDFAPGNTATAFFSSMTFASDNSIYGVKKIKGVYKVTENTIPVAFVSSAQGITQNVNCINYDKNRNVLWAGANNGTVYRITLNKDVKKFTISGNCNALRVTANTIYAVASDNNKELIWKIPVISADSLGTPELYFDVSSGIDSLIKISDIVVDQDGYLYIGTDKETDPIYVIHPDKSFEIFYSGIFNSAVYSLVWGNDKYVYMSNTIKSVNTTIFKIDMQKLGSQ